MSHALKNNIKEFDRLSELLSYAQLDTASDPDLDAIVALAATLCDASGSMINLIDADRQWSKSLYGVEASWKELGREDSMCTHTIENHGFLEVTDFSHDPAFRHHPITTGNSEIAHYAGVPLLSPQGMALGALCVVTDRPRQLTDRQKQSLEHLSHLAMTILESKNPLNRVATGVAQRNHGIVYIDPETAAVRFCNRRVGDLTGQNELLMQGLPATMLCAEWTPEFLKSLKLSVIEQSLNTPQQILLTSTSDHAVTVSVRWTLMNHYGKPLLVAVLEDRSAEAAQELASNERNLFFELSQDIILVCNPDGTIRDVNPSFTRVLGYQLNDLRGVNPLDLIHSEDQFATLQDLKNLNANAISVGHVNRVRDVHGEYRWLSWSSVISPDGKIYASAQDITETRKHTRKLSLLQQAIDCSQNPIIVANLEQPGGVVEYVNDAFETTTGYAKHEVIGRNCGFLQGKDKNQPGIQKIREAMKTRSKAHVLLRNYRKDGSMFWNELYLSPFQHESSDVTHYVGVQYDVTELVNQRDQIVRLNRIESLRSAFNSTIEFGSSAGNLSSEFCEVATSVGQYPLVWIANVDATSGTLVLESAHGAFAEKMEAGTDLSDLPTAWTVPYLGPALESQEPVIFQRLDNTHLPQETEYRLNQEGFYSIAFFPVVKNGKTEKLACFYSGELNAFDEKESVVIGNLLEDYGVAEQLANSAEELHRIAHRDDITGLPNQELMAKLVSDMLSHDPGRQGQPGAFVTVVIDRLIEIVGQIGRVKGRALLQDISGKLQALLPKSGILSHTDFGHFCLFLKNIDSKEDAADFIETSLLPIFDELFQLSDDLELYVSGRIGIAMLENAPEDCETLIDHSKVAALSSSQPDIRYQFYSDSLTESSRLIIRQEAELRESIRDNRFELHFQPKVNLRTNRVESMEGLLRWNHAERGLVSPGEFIPLLEDTGLITHLTSWLLHEAHAAAQAFNEVAEVPIRVAINLSQLQLRQTDFMSLVDQFMADCHVTPETNLVDLEITESLFADNIEATSVILSALQERGFQIAIDDFGTGFSSLSYLARLPFDSLKIDLSFIRRMTTSVEDMSIVSTIIGLSKSLDKHVIAEGVETQEQANLLRLINCTLAQGYLISKPVPPPALSGLIQTQSVINYST